MPFKCSVTACSGNYDKSYKVSLFRFPKDQEMQRKWLAAIPRKDFQITNNSRVCERHFNEAEIIRNLEGYDDKSGKSLVCPLKNPKLRSDAVPSIFPGCPSYLTKTIKTKEAPSEKRVRMDNLNFSKAIASSIKEQENYEKNFCFKTLADLYMLIEKVNIPETWIKIEGKDCLTFASILFSPCPSIESSVVIDKNLKVSCFHKSVSISKFGKYSFPFEIHNVHEINDILSSFVTFENNRDITDLLALIKDTLSELLNYFTDEKSNVILFMLEQIDLIKLHKTQRRYKPEFLVFSSLVFSISPHAYKFLYNSQHIIFPHPSTLKRLCASYDINPAKEQTDEKLLLYIKDKFQYLNEKDKTVVFSMDEIHIKPLIDYKGGNLVGMSYNSEGIATTAYAFMIQSITSTYKDVVHILPLKKASAELLHSFVYKLIILLEKIGFFVFCVSSDNNSINRKAMTYFANPPILSIVYPHPVNPKRPLFYLIDVVHLVKCVRNNWLNQKNSGVCMYYPDFQNISSVESNNGQKLKAASLSTLRQIHKIEANEIAKYCHTLSEKALFPSNLERQSVKLALQIFNNSTVEGLKLVGPLHSLLNFDTTADFIKIICTWWDIVNVHTLFKGKFKRDVYKEPLTSSHDDPRFLYLNKFVNWLLHWKTFNCDTGVFSNETHNALIHTTHALLEISKYCTDELKLNFILTGKFQTDCLEERFGLYRQLSGSLYNISLTQVYENETKLRIRSLLPLCINSKAHGKIEVTSLDPADTFDNITSHNVSDSDTFRIIVDENDINSVKNLVPVLTYIAGYCAHACLKKLKCVDCKQNILLNGEIDFVENVSHSLVKAMDRGGLKYPCDEVIYIVIFNYLVVNKLVGEKYENIFNNAGNQREIVCQITLKTLSLSEIFLPFDICANKHSAEYITKCIIYSSTNVFLKNYSKKVNDLLKVNKNESKTLKRKITTLQK